ncbi:hypothetical protein BDV93DRAFT_355840 [Ceratobasidium sp. AG-I]|nr:hypothetical protein BDV93DRAFT_355840 [Ceratobasidium sp. AG-I]
MNSHYTPSSQTGSRHGCTRLAEIQKGPKRGVGQALSKRRVPRTEGTLTDSVSKSTPPCTTKTVGLCVLRQIMAKAEGL